jgi:hypothetical protein
MLEWPSGAKLTRQIDFALPRGVTVSGKVTEKDSGKPVAGASIEFVPRRVDNPFFKGSVLAPSDEFKQVGISGPDGSFTLTVLPGPGHLLVLGSTLDYLRVEIGRRMLTEGWNDGRRLYPNALVGLNLKPETKTHEVAITLRRGVTVKARLEGPDGKPVQRAEVFGRPYIPLGYTLEHVHRIYVQDGTFELPGCDPGNPQDVFVFDDKNALGAVVRFPPKKADKQPVTIRLQKCGTATVRFVDKEGKAIEDVHPRLELQLTPRVLTKGLPAGTLAADGLPLDFLDRGNWNRKPDAKGRFTFTGLIPGATFHLEAMHPSRGLWQTGKTFTVEPGQAVDLKDITVQVK